MLIAHFLGWLIGVWPSPPGTPPTYQFFSGSFLAVTMWVGWWHKNNCHKPRCMRVGRHIVDGTPWCDKHHEEARNTG